MSFLISVFVILVVPKLVGVEAYGYWQLYLFYVLYVGFLHFGWCDGIYLRYGGFDYQCLDKKLFYSQFVSLFLLQILMAVSLLFFTKMWVADSDKVYVIRLTSLSLFAINMRWMLLYILQATNRIKEYANAIMIERVSYLLLLLVALVLGVRNIKIIIWTDVIGKYLSLFYAIYFCRDMVFRKLTDFTFSYKELWKNISAGSKLMFSNIASMLIIGTVRYGIERQWDVATFGKVSLTLSVSNMLMLFINAVGLVLYPVLRRTNQDNLSRIYTMLRQVLMPILFSALVIYYPLKEVLSLWLPRYAESLMYMALLFPICVYEGKMALLINTYLKTLRQEKLMLKINLLSFGLSVIATFSLSFLVFNLNWLIASIVFLLAFRSILSELLLARLLKINLLSAIVIESIMVLVFILLAWFVNSWITPIAYTLALVVYLLLQRSDLKAAIQEVKLLTK